MESLNEFYWKVDRLAHKFLPYNLIVKYRVHCSLLYAALTFSMFAGHIKNFKTATPFIAFSLWHFALYMYNRYTDRGEDALNSEIEAMNDFHGRIAVWLTGVVLVAGLGLLLYGGYKPIYYLLSLPCVFLYGQSLFGGKFRIKAITLVKNIYAVFFCWILPMLLVAATYAGGLDALRQNPPWAGILAMFFGIMVYELLWDLRDVDGDRKSGVMTVPVRFGEDACKLLVGILLAAAYVFDMLPADTIVFLAFFAIIIRERCAPVVTHVMILSQFLIFYTNILKMMF